MIEKERQSNHSTLEQPFKNKLLAQAALWLQDGTASTAPADLSKACKTFLRLENQRLKSAHYLGAGGLQSAVRRSLVLDQLVKAVFRAGSGATESIGKEDSGCAIIAVGGYGRGELAPYSDLDLLFLHRGNRTAQIRQIVENVVRVLWDAGLTVGHSLRTVSDCIATAHSDPHFRTALVNTRLLGGDTVQFEALLEALKKEQIRKADAFIEIIKRERAVRYSKYGSAVCLLEPNIKEGAGGIRDLHTALWAAYARYNCRTLEELRARDLITEEERLKASRAYDFLWRVRYSAHLLTGRKTERLSLDLQAALAAEYGYKPGRFMLDSEKFMREYYRHAIDLHLFSETMLSRTSESEAKRTHWWNRRQAQHAIEPFSIREGQIILEGETSLFAQYPLAFFDAFNLAQAAGLPLSASLREAMRKNLSAVDADFRGSVEAASEFLKLLRRRGRVGHALRLMHEVGFLSRFMPEFGRINLLVQHDNYHHYTVDEHTLKAIEALDGLVTDQEKQHDHLRIVFDEVEDPALLYLSILLHDLGKGRGRGHIGRGVTIATRICERLKLDDKQTAKVLLQVKNHVAMAQIAQRRDLNDAETIDAFAEEVATVDGLHMLLLLTFGDLNAVGPGVWSDWKGTLLWELYRRSRALMTGQNPLASDSAVAARFKTQVVNALEGTLPLSEVERHLALLPDRYIRSTRPEAAATHLHLIEQLKSNEVTLRWLTQRKGATELTICTNDRHGLFADISGAFAGSGVEILSAELNTREDGIVIDVFILREASTQEAIAMHRYAPIERTLRRAVMRDLDVASFVERWRSHHAPRKRLRTSLPRRLGLPQITVENDSSTHFTMIEVHAVDEPGLAYKVASGLEALKLDIVCAKIATEKNDALDVFYVTDSDGSKLMESQIDEVRVALHDRLSEDSFAAAKPAPAVKGRK